MKIRILDGRCQGHARCATLAPETFDLDGDGYAYLRPGQETFADTDTDARERARLAADNCPEEAIVLAEEG
jgi:ferredoxin